MTAVGQDNLGEDAPPDAVVRATAGADFGFPICNWTKRSSCAPFTKPAALLRPHTTPTGIAVIGANAFVGTYGYNSVLRMPVKGSQPKPFLTDFPSPVVAVGANRATSTWARSRARSTGSGCNPMRDQQLPGCREDV